MNPQLKEIAPWRIATEICRRHHEDLTIIETHPCSGQYDCLSIISVDRVHIADLNRMGRLRFFLFVDGKKNDSEPMDMGKNALFGGYQRSSEDGLQENAPRYSR